MLKTHIGHLIALGIIIALTTLSVFAAEDDGNGEYPQADVPNSLIECYTQLDSLLSPEDIEGIKNCEYDDLIQYHFGLGLWIRNNWIYRSVSDPESFFAQFMKSERMGHPDSMSQFIIEGYHYYLNNEEYSVELKKEKEHEQYMKKRMLKFGLLFISIAIVLSCRFLFRKLPYPARLLKLIGRPKIIRVFVVLCISSLLISGAESVLSRFAGNDILYRIECVYAVILALILSAGAMFCFADMTKREIALSAVLPCLYSFVLLILKNYFDLYNLYDLTFPMTYRFYLEYLVESDEWPVFLNGIFIFFPFVYVFLSRTKKTENSETPLIT